jgi:hypothetical protein
MLRRTISNFLGRVKSLRHLAVAVLFAFAAMNDAILLHVKVADWNLLWYAGVVGMAFSFGKAMIPNVDAQPHSSRNLFAEIDEAPPVVRGVGFSQSTQPEQ